MVDVKVVPSELTAVSVCFPCYVGSGWWRSLRIRCHQRLTAGSIHPDPGVHVFSFGRVLPPWQGGKPRAVPSQRHAGSVGSSSKSCSPWMLLGRLGVGIGGAARSLGWNAISSGCRSCVCTPGCSPCDLPGNFGSSDMADCLGMCWGSEASACSWEPLAVHAADPP